MCSKILVSMSAKQKSLQNVSKTKKHFFFTFCTATIITLWMNMLLFIRISKTRAKPFPQEEKVPSQTAAFLEETCGSYLITRLFYNSF